MEGVQDYKPSFGGWGRGRSKKIGGEGQKNLQAKVEGTSHSTKFIS